MNHPKILRKSLVLLLPLLFAFGCGDDDEEEAGSDRYCELVAEVEGAGEEIFGELGDDATDEELVAAEAELVDRMRDELDEMARVAPEPIAADVAAYVAAYEDRAAGEEGADVSEQEERILAYEERNC
jgi:hypothetical protein